MQAELARAQAKYRKQGTRTDQHPTNSRKLGSQGPDNRERLLRRLARDHSDILARARWARKEKPRPLAVPGLGGPLLGGWGWGECRGPLPNKCDRTADVPGPPARWWGGAAPPAPEVGPQKGELIR
jgi:hypothetical protein